MLIVLVIVVFILSAAYSGATESELEGNINETIRQEKMALEEEPEMGWEEWEERKRARLERKYNLHVPKHERVFYQAFDVLTLDFGEANEMTTDDGDSSMVFDIIMDRLPNTIMLFTTAAVIYTALGIAVGLKAAQKAGSITDRFLSLFSITASSMPMWWVGMLAVMIGVYELGLFPAPDAQFGTVERMGRWDYTTELLSRMVLPLIVIVFVFFGTRAWTTRNIVTGVLQDDYIMAARAKGVPERKVIYGHTLKTAAPPIVTSAIMALLLSLGGAMISEIIFRWPGMGLLLRSALLDYYDVPVILGISFITSFLYVFGYYIADLIYGFLDPRVEVGAGSQV
ncbi:MAG: ABC transporter permease [Candidatus Thermoplasmatota archaeon]